MTLDHNATDTHKCHLWPKEPRRCRNISIVLQTFSSLSLIGCLVIVGLIMILKKYKSTLQSLILWLSVSDFFRSLVYLLPHPKKNQVTYCHFKGFFDQYFISAHLLWVFMITVNCLLIVKRMPYQQYYKWCHVMVWVGSLFLAIIPFIKDSYGEAGIWCWIKHDTGFRFGVWYAPLFVLGFCMISINVYLIWFLMKNQRHGNNRSDDERTAHKRMRKDLILLFAYPVFYILFYIPIFIYRVTEETNPNGKPNYGLTIAIVVLTPCLGVVYAVAFVLINASLKEISITLLKEKLLNIPRHKISYITVKSLTRSRLSYNSINQRSII